MEEANAPPFIAYPTETRQAPEVPPMDTKIVINRCFGGFSLSDAAYEKLVEWGIPVRKVPSAPFMAPRELTIFDTSGENEPPKYYALLDDQARCHPLLVRVVEELGKDASGSCSELAVVKVPEGVSWHIAEYDGLEHVAEDHRTWE